MTPPEYLYLEVKAAGELQAKGVATPFKKEYIRKDGSARANSHGRDDSGRAIANQRRSSHSSST